MADMVAARSIEETVVRRRVVGKPLALCVGSVVVTALLAVLASSARSMPMSAATAGVSPVDAALEVAVVGDSLVASTTPEQQAELARRGYAASVAGNPGKPLTDAWIQARLDETRDAEVVVIATASNDNVQLAQRAAEVGRARASEEYGQILASTIARVAAPCTVVVDVREQTSPLYRPETAPVTNTALRATAAGAEQATVVVPWSVRSAGHDHRDWFVRDELHFTTDSQRQDAGVQAYSDAIADGVDECKARLSEANSDAAQ
jgi:hypothetical protein